MSEKSLAERRFLPSAAAGLNVVTRDDGGKTLVGYSAVFYRDGDLDTQFELFDGVVERISRGAFDRAIREKHDARALFNHDPNNLLGRVSSGTVSLSVDDVGLRYEIPFDADDPDHQRVLRKIERGDLSGSSFAFIPTRTTWTETDDLTVRNIEDVDLFDVGPVTYPAYEGTTAAARAASGSLEAVRADLEGWKREAEWVVIKRRVSVVDSQELARVNYLVPTALIVASRVV